MTISRRLRFEILRRDGHTCRYCGAIAPDVVLTVDHVVPQALGGSDEPSNLVTACQPCNAGKSSIAPDAAIVADVDAASLLFARAIERAAEIRRQDAADMADQLQRFRAYWSTWGWTDAETGKRVRVEDEYPLTASLPHDWRPSIERFIANGLAFEDLEHFVAETMQYYKPDDYFRFFCSKCWNEIGARQEMARQLIEDGEV